MKGLALVVVLWIIVILTVIVTVVGKTVRLDSRVSLTSVEQQRAKWALRAGIEKALAILNDDYEDSDSLNDTWTDDITGGQETTSDSENGILLEGCITYVEIADEASKLNINTATKEQLIELPGMTDEIVASILDWRDKDDDPKISGAERGYYINLDVGYQIRNADFKTIRELLLVKAVTPEIFWGQNYRRRAILERQRYYHNSEYDDDGIEQDEEEDVDRGLYAYLTCYSYDNNKDADGNNRVNINSADENKLTSELKISKSHAKWIVDNRKDNYKSIADLIDENSKKEPDKDQPENPDQAQALDLQTFSQMVDKITIKDDAVIPGRININTAPKPVLVALLEGDRILADSIINQRNKSHSGMTSIGELLDMKELSVKTFKKIADHITTRSSVYQVNCMAQSHLTRAIHQVTAIVDRGQSPATILYWHQGDEF